MAKVLKWLVILALGLMLLLAAVAFTLHRWVSTDDFRQRVQREASSALGVPVTLEGIAVDVWPLPAVALSGIAVQSAEPITVGRLEVRPLWRPMLSGRLEVATLLVRRAVVPQKGVDALVLALEKKQGPPKTTAPKEPTPNAAVMALLPRRTVLDDITWISATGKRTTLEAEAKLADDGLPQGLKIKLLQGNLAGLQATLQRQDTAGGAANGALWALHVDVGGGTVEGQIGLQSSANAGNKKWAVTGQLQTTGVEVAALTVPSKTLTGQLQATTTLEGQATSTAALMEGLRTHTRFTVRNAVLVGIDLAKAVRTVGLSRGGQTALDTLSGEVSTQGKAIALNNLVARSGVLSATGNVTISPAKALSGRITAALAGETKVGSALGVPLTVGGTLDKPEVSLSRSALLGAAIGTAVLPGVGTGAGANLGDKVGSGLRGLFGGK